jgi:nucleotide-binding universal stress UspA family protein
VSMCEKILVALDGSQLSERVLPYARAFAQALKIPVELLHVIDPEDFRLLSEPSGGRYYESEDERRKSSSAYLKAVTETFSNAARANFSVDVGNPAEVIVNRAAADSGALIAMATHGRSGLKRWLLGSVAAKVLEAAVNPVFLARSIETAESREVAALKTILVPLDGSPLAERIIPYVVETAKKANLEVILMRVYLVPGIAYPTGDYQPNWERLHEETRKAADDYLDEKMRQLLKQGLARVSSVSLEGSAAEKIIRLAQGKPECFITMCTHGKTGVGRWVLGSVTDRVSRHGDAPVLVIPASIAP